MPAESLSWGRADEGQSGGALGSVAESEMLPEQHFFITELNTTMSCYNPTPTPTPHSNVLQPANAAPDFF